MCPKAGLIRAMCTSACRTVLALLFRAPEPDVAPLPYSRPRLSGGDVGAADQLGGLLVEPLLSVHLATEMSGVLFPLSSRYLARYFPSVRFLTLAICSSCSSHQGWH